jgi:hypothetical protein
VIEGGSRAGCNTVLARGSSILVDHVIGGRKQRRRDLDAERFRGLAVEPACGHPITGIAAHCARAVSGKAAAQPSKTPRPDRHSSPIKALNY